MRVRVCNCACVRVFLRVFLCARVHVCAHVYVHVSMCACVRVRFFYFSLFLNILNIFS